ncbi:MAG: hypothetical protein LBD45_04960, partial [Bacteroidales bacterium]|nr:hypothetical protein [Bacteroidales bacterium]
MKEELNQMIEKKTSQSIEDREDKLMIEVRDIFRGEVIDRTESDSVIVFVIEGTIYVSVGNKHNSFVSRNKMFLISPGMHWAIDCLDEGALLFCHLKNLTQLCERLKLESLLHEKKKVPTTGKQVDLMVLDVNHFVEHSVKGLNMLVRSGVKYEYLLENIIMEILLLIRMYYPKEAL